jgi:hypothetical protein
MYVLNLQLALAGLKSTCMSGDSSLQLLLQNQALCAFIFSSPFAKAALLRKTRHFFRWVRFLYRHWFLVLNVYIFMF